jgi:Flp pilus assembly protein TadG
MGIFRLPLPQRVATGLRRLAANPRGNVAVEFALGAPVLFMMIFGIVQLGYALWVQNALDESVAAASRCASVGSSACAGQVTSYAASQSGAPVDASAFTYSCRSADPCTNNTVTCGCQVTASYSMPLAIPWTNLSVNLSSQSCYAPPPKNSCPSA